MPLGSITQLLLLTLSASTSSAGRLLTIFPVPFRDHQIVFRPLIENLLQRGHNVTVVTTNPEFFEIRSSSLLNGDRDSVSDQLEIIDLSFAHNLKVLNILKNDESSPSGSDMLRSVMHVMRKIAEAELKSIQMETLLNSTDHRHYDAVIVDWSGPTLMNAFAYKFQAPLIGITPGGAYITAHEAIGNPNHPVAFPSILMPFSEDLTLFQRIASTFFALKYRYLYFSEIEKQYEIAKHYFGLQTPSLWEIESNVDLLLVNSYQALGNSRPIGPTTIYLGGIHALNKLPPLSYDLQKFLDKPLSSLPSSSVLTPPTTTMSLSSGVVYINLGERLTRLFIESNRFEKLLKSIEKSSFDVVLNLNGIVDEVKFNTTANIYQSMTIEQESVLAHPNVKLFITPGGQRDIEDAIHHKVPVLGITFTSNLEHYLRQVLKHDAGKIINIDLDTPTEFLAKIEAFAVTERFQKNIEKLQQLITDQPQKSMERCIWYIEFLIRRGETKEIYQNRLSKMSWFQYLLLDVFIAVIFTTVAFVSAIVFVCIRIRQYSKSLPFEKVTRRSKAKML